MAALTESLQVRWFAVLGGVVEMRHGQDDLAASDRVGLGILCRAPLTFPAGGLSDAKRDGFPIGRISRTVFGTDWHHALASAGNILGRAGDGRFHCAERRFTSSMETDKPGIRLSARAMNALV
jgi:hypothetical protein